MVYYILDQKKELKQFSFFAWTVHVDYYLNTTYTSAAVLHIEFQYIPRNITFRKHLEDLAGHFLQDQLNITQFKFLIQKIQYI